jgi:hypothetical protein
MSDLFEKELKKAIEKSTREGTYAATAGMELALCLYRSPSIRSDRLAGALEKVAKDEELSGMIMQGGGLLEAVRVIREKKGKKPKPCLKCGMTEQQSIGKTSAHICVYEKVEP